MARSAYTVRPAWLGPLLRLGAAPLAVGLALLLAHDPRRAEASLPPRPT